MVGEASRAWMRSSGLPMAEMVNGGEYFLPCSEMTLPEHMTAELNSTRWSMTFMYSAPPSHRALITASMSCWWITYLSMSADDPDESTACFHIGESSRVTVTPGPSTAGITVLASPPSSLLLGSLSLVDSLVMVFTSLLSAFTSFCRVLTCLTRCSTNPAVSDETVLVWFTRRLVTNR